MPKYQEGDQVTITFNGTVKRQYESGSLSVQRAHSGTVSWFEADEQKHISVILHRKPFNPKSGEVYLLRAAGGSGEWTTWYVVQRNSPLGPEMVSPAGIYSLQMFKECYVNDAWELVKADVSPGNK